MADVRISGLTAKAPVADADVLAIEDSAASFATRKTTILDVLNQFSIVGKTAKTMPVASDNLIVADSEAGDVLKKVALSDLCAFFATTTGYGQIYGNPGVARTVNVTTSYAAIPTNVYSTSGLINNVTSDAANGRLTAGVSGVYRVNFGLLARRTALITDLDFAVFTVSGDVQHLAATIEDVRLDTLAKVTNVNGFISLTAGDVVEIRTKRDSGASTFELWHASFTLELLHAT